MIKVKGHSKCAIRLMSKLQLRLRSLRSLRPSPARSAAEGGTAPIRRPILRHDSADERRVLQHNNMLASLLMEEIKQVRVHERRFLMNTERMLSDYDHPAIQAKANELTSDKLTLLDKVESLFGFVRDEI
jgi:hypothetical protein